MAKKSDYPQTLFVKQEEDRDLKYFSSANNPHELTEDDEEVLLGVYELVKHVKAVKKTETREV